MFSTIHKLLPGIFIFFSYQYVFEAKNYRKKPVVSMLDPSTYNCYRRRQLTSINSVKRLRRKTASTTTTLPASNVETSYASTTAASKAGASGASAASARSSSSTNVYFLALLLSGIFLLGLFTVKTWTRNYDWNSRRALFR